MTTAWSVKCHITYIPNQTTKPTEDKEMGALNELITINQIDLYNTEEIERQFDIFQIILDLMIDKYGTEKVSHAWRKYDNKNFLKEMEQNKERKIKYSYNFPPEDERNFMKMRLSFVDEFNDFEYKDISCDERINKNEKTKKRREAAIKESMEFWGVDNEDDILF